MCSNKFFTIFSHRLFLSYQILKQSHKEKVDFSLLKIFEPTPPMPTAATLLCICAPRRPPFLHLPVHYKEHPTTSSRTRSRTRTLRRGLSAAVGELVVEADCGREREQCREHERVEVVETVRGARVARQWCRQRRVLARGSVGEPEIAHQCTQDNRKTTKFKDYLEDCMAKMIVRICGRTIRALSFN